MLCVRTWGFGPRRRLFVRADEQCEAFVLRYVAFHLFISLTWRSAVVAAPAGLFRPRGVLEAAMHMLGMEAPVIMYRCR